MTGIWEWIDQFRWSFAYSNPKEFLLSFLLLYLPSIPITLVVGPLGLLINVLEDVRFRIHNAFLKSNASHLDRVKDVQRQVSIKSPNLQGSH